MLKAMDEDKNDVIGNLFEVELDVETKCAENEAEPATHNTESVLKLSCFIDNNGTPIDNMQDGIKISFNGEMDKNSPSLGREARYTQTKKINKLVSNNKLVNCPYIAFISLRQFREILLERSISHRWN
jgi:hypothetical protein